MVRNTDITLVIHSVHLSVSFFVSSEWLVLPDIDTVLSVAVLHYVRWWHDTPDLLLAVLVCVTGLCNRWQKVTDLAINVSILTLLQLLLFPMPTLLVAGWSRLRLRCIWTTEFQQTKHAKCCQMSSKMVSPQLLCRLKSSDGFQIFISYVSVTKEERFVLLYL